MKLQNKKGNRKVAAVVIFFGCMFLLTLISRFIDSYRIPIVSAEQPQPGRISVKYSCRGTIDASELSYLEVKGGFYVSQVFTDEGAWVKEGDALYSYLPEEIEQVLLQKQAEWHERKTLEDDAQKEHEQAAVRLKLQLLEQELDELENLKRSGGTVTAPVTGILISFPVTAGTRSEFGDYMTFGTDIYVKIAPEDWKDTWNPLDGTQALVTVFGKESFAIFGTFENTENGCILSITEEKCLYGSEVEVQWNEQTEEFPMTLPIEALCQKEKNQYFVYRLRKSSGILGEKEYAEYIPVTVEAKGEGFAAITSALLPEDLVILPGDNQIKDGARVRVSQKK